MGRLFTLGEVLAVLMADDGLPLARSRRFRRFSAGSESNVAAGLVRLGHRARMLTAVGRDALVDGVADSLSGWGVDAVVLRSDRVTGTIVRTPGTDSGADAVHLRRDSAAGDLSAADVEAAWEPDIDVVFVSGITLMRSASARAAALRTLELARAAGAMTVVDPNIRPFFGRPADYREGLAGVGPVDLAIGDAAELAALAGTDQRDAVASLLAAGCAAVVRKGGEAGATLFTDGDEVVAPSRATRVVDTVGAGDAFAAGLIAGYIERLDMRDALALASVVAGRVVESLEDVAGFPHRAHLTEEELV